MRKSEQINEISAALSKAQGEIQNALKSSSNPYFNSTYADLAAVIGACREQLSKNNLAVSQIPIKSENGWTLVTTLLHSSGQWLEGDVPILANKQDAQGFGSGMTYARRYGLAAIVGVAQEDDDGNKAVGPKESAQDKEKRQVADANAKAMKQKKEQENQNGNKTENASNKNIPSKNEAPIGQTEAKQIFAVAAKRSVKNEDVKEILKGLYDVDSTAQLKKWQYEEVVKLLETKDLSEIGHLIIERQSEKMMSEELK